MTGLTRVRGFVPDENVNLSELESQTHNMELWWPLTICTNRKDNRFLRKGGTC